MPRRCKQQERFVRYGRTDDSAETADGVDRPMVSQPTYGSPSLTLRQSCTVLILPGRRIDSLPKSPGPSVEVLKSRNSVLLQFEHGNGGAKAGRSGSRRDVQAILAFDKFDVELTTRRPADSAELNPPNDYRRQQS